MHIIRLNIINKHLYFISDVTENKQPVPLKLCLPLYWVYFWPDSRRAIQKAEKVLRTLTSHKYISVGFNVVLFYEGTSWLDSSFREARHLILIIHTKEL
jgi:hypothetical protein